MSLSSLLLASGPKKIDKELDALFKTNPAPPRNPATAIQVPTPGSASAPPAKKKRKLDAVEASPNVPPVSEAGLRKTKRTKAAPETTPKPSPKIAAKSSQKLAKATTPAKESKSKGASKKSKPKRPQSEDEDIDSNKDEDEDNSDLENAYLGKQQKKRPASTKRADPSENSDNRADSEDEDEDMSDANPKEDDPQSEGNDASDIDSDADPDPDAPPPVHESLTKRVRTKPTKKAKIVPESETPAQRDARTLFVGGLPIEVVQKKAIQKQLSRHLLAFLPPGSKVKIESTRFRSVAFRDPTSSTALSTDAKVSANAVPIPGANHAAARASTWRKSGKGANDAEGGESGGAAQGAGGDGDGDTEKQYLTPAQKKKILFIQGAIHPEARGVNAYVVFAHHTLGTGDAEAEAGAKEEDEDTPYRAAAHVARAANASVFMERTLRVDLCAPLPSSSSGADGMDMGGAAGDPKRSVFVGNLDFGAREDDVREFFEGVVAGERGPAPTPTDEAVEGTTAPVGGRWVLGVRLVRDRETQLGKGFGYVRFVDRECVDEILALAKTDEGRAKLKFAKRALRVQRCRAPGASSSNATAARANARGGKTETKGQSKSKSTYPPTPPKRGDPTLGARLAHLDKDERKAAKKADAARVGRRAEKKKMGARMRVGVGSDKIKVATVGSGTRVGGRKGDKGKGKATGKERERERKVRVSKHVGGKGGK
ncbi:hypothetical protein B0H11DRAFT_1279696 [Mycena galericulata]|nr:hypothetical protein B0H11DRAFT_1279696 [Mycena galericulata]